MESIVCTVCGEGKPNDRFYWRASGKPAGKRCKDCNNEERRQKRAKNPEHYRKLARDSIARRNEEQKQHHRDYQREYQRNYYHKNLEANRKKALERYHRYYKEHPEIFKAIYLRRSARLRTGDYRRRDTTGIREVLLKQQKGKCANCGVKMTEAFGPRQITVDHIIPLAKGGRHEDSNFQILCRACNRLKWDKTPLEFAREQGRLL